jgi:hypothetical protein|tara:strand:+ start:84430 stop:84843 length:414 start_codon:yes stop_codon:yes gene_type:complete
LTNTFSTGTRIGSSEIDRFSSAVIFACDLDLPDDPSGLIWEQGGNAVGAYAGFRSDGALVIRAGLGYTLGQVSGSQAALLYLPKGSISGSGTLVWEITGGNSSSTPIQIRAWWKGVSIGTVISTHGVAPWAGGNEGT